MPHPAPSARAAFTLIEISIVLVILGLLAGGILAGKALVRASEIRAATSEYQRYATAVHSFRDKYFGWPGDITNATAFWGVADPTPGTCVTTAATGTATCNGNGDTIIVPSAGSNEPFRFWQHLANARMIEGGFSGVTDGATNYSATSNNVPKSKLAGGWWFVWNWGDMSGNAEFFTSSIGNAFELGGQTANSDPLTPIFTPEELWSLDSKIDNGVPATGKLVVRGWPACTNAVSATDLTATYRLSSKNPVCVAIFRQQV